MSFCVAVTCRASSSSGGPVEGGCQHPRGGYRGPRGYFAGQCRGHVGDPARDGGHGSPGGEGSDLLEEEVSGTERKAKDGANNLQAVVEGKFSRSPKSDSMCPSGIFPDVSF
jgi:hypothetical protein